MQAGGAVTVAGAQRYLKYSSRITRYRVLVVHKSIQEYDVLHAKSVAVMITVQIIKYGLLYRGQDCRAVTVAEGSTLCELTPCCIQGAGLSQ